MLSRLIIGFVHSIVEFILWLSLIVSIVAGYVTGYTDFGEMAGFGGLAGAFVGLIIWLFFSVFIGGPILLILDIRQRVENIEQRGIGPGATTAPD